MWKIVGRWGHEVGSQTDHPLSIVAHRLGLALSRDLYTVCNENEREGTSLDGQINRWYRLRCWLIEDETSNPQTRASCPFVSYRVGPSRTDSCNLPCGSCQTTPCGPACSLLQRGFKIHGHSSSRPADPSCVDGTLCSLCRALWTINIDRSGPSVHVKMMGT